MIKITFKDKTVIEYLQANWVYHRDGETCELRDHPEGQQVAEVPEIDIERIEDESGEEIPSLASAARSKESLV